MEIYKIGQGAQFKKPIPSEQFVNEYGCVVIFFHLITRGYYLLAKQRRCFWLTKFVVLKRP